MSYNQQIGKKILKLAFSILFTLITVTVFADQNEGAIVSTIHIAATGDIMNHHVGRKNFNGLLDGIGNFFDQSDLVIANLETPIVASSFSNYPLFGTHENLLVYLREFFGDKQVVLGFANNHSFDKGAKGVISTIEYLKRNGFLTAGAYTNVDESEEITLLEIKGIKIAVLAYTNLFNFYPKKDKNLIRALTKENLTADISKAKELGAELITVLVHWGEEYNDETRNLKRIFLIGKQEKEMAYWMAEQGVDIIIGSHPHIVKPIEIVEIEYLEQKKQFLVAWSLGNLTSSQPRGPRRQGIVLDIGVTKAKHGFVYQLKEQHTTTVSNGKVMPKPEPKVKSIKK
jgi:poly-gamma-glutamate synthesis protein (capsule biosynthesis protein)